MEKIETTWGHLAKGFGWYLLAKLSRGAAAIIDCVVKRDNVEGQYLIIDFLKTANDCYDRGIKHATIYRDMKIGK